MISVDSLISFILEEGSFVSQTNSWKNLCSPSTPCLLRDSKPRFGISMWAEGWRLVEQVPAVSLCNTLTWFKKLDPLDAEEMLCLAQNRFPLSQSLLMVCVVEWLFLQLCLQQYLQERLGRCTTACLPCSPCLSVYSDMSAWHVGTGRMTKRPGCVHYVAED